MRAFLLASVETPPNECDEATPDVSLSYRESALGTSYSPTSSYEPPEDPYSS